jgi:Predicted acyltransferases
MNKVVPIEAAYQPRLEALRGIAALMVAYTHAIGGIRLDSEVSRHIKSGLSTLGNGSAAVTIFFVLSGYVLSVSLDRKIGSTGQVLFHFLSRRALRIWPAMLVVITCCFLWIILVFEPVTYAIASPGYTRTWSRPAEPLDIVLDALFIQNFLDPVTWTLQVEMVAAALFVPLWLFCRRWPVASIAILAAWLAYFLLAPMYVNARSGFVFMFIMGINVSHGIQLISTLRAPHWPATLFTISLLGCSLVTKLIPETQALCWTLEAIFAYWAIAALVATHPENRIWVTDNRLVRFMGRISYSFYLWHFPILFVLGGYLFAYADEALLSQWPNLAGSIAFVLSTMLTTPVAWLSYRYIERPGINLARSIRPPKKIRP